MQREANYQATKYGDGFGSEHDFSPEGSKGLLERAT
jgi:hypothetical protein